MNAVLIFYRKNRGERRCKESIKPLVGNNYLLF